MDHARSHGFELLILVLGGAALLVGGVVWGGAVVASLFAGGPALPEVGDVGAALRRLGATPGDPARAWPPAVGRDLPGPIVYWLATAIVAGVVLGAVVLALRWCAGPRVGSVRRRPLGVEGRARFATRREMAPLLVDQAAPGRFVVARFGRRLVATECRGQASGRRWWSSAGSRRQGDRGAVALVGPTRSGKTVAVIGGILEWDGPAVLSSVKADLLSTTGGWRRRQGAVRVYDPTGTVPAAAPMAASWSPIRQAGTVVGAQRAARALCDAAPRGGVEGGLDFWLAQAEILLSGLLFVAHHSKQHMGVVCNWVLTQDRPGKAGQGEVKTTLKMLTSSDDDEVACAAAEVDNSLRAIWEMEDRTRSSVYATAQTIVWPWSAPAVAASSTGDSVDLDWLLSGPNTLYLCSPIEDQRRLAPAIGGVLNDVIGHAYRHVAETGRPLDPPLLIVIDEAGNTPLRSLPEYASTLSGVGILLVTVWQSLAQMEATYGRQADTILTNHLTKLFYAGVSDPATFRYVGQVLGDAEVETVSRSAEERMGRGSIQRSATSVPLAPAHALRQMRPGDGLLVHGTLPPAHVRVRRYFRDPDLASRAALDLSAPAASTDTGHGDRNVVRQDGGR